MATLAFQTASGPAEIALLTGEPAGASGHLTCRSDTAGGPGQDARLPGLLEALLAEAGIGLDSVTRIGVVSGPGSFTGLRTGLAFARGLGLVRGCPVLGITLLEAALPPEETGAVRVALQAQKRPPDLTFWCQDFTAGRPDGPPAERSPDALVADGREILTDRPDLLSGQARAVPAKPSAAHVARWAAIRSPGEAPPSPVYVRPPDAALPGGRGR